jgi:hypothetical protein
MPWDQNRKRDHHVMFVVSYGDGRTAYIRVAPNLLERGDHIVPAIARERQEKGEIPDGEIKGVKRVR